MTIADKYLHWKFLFRSFLKYCLYNNLKYLPRTLHVLCQNSGSSKILKKIHINTYKVFCQTFMQSFCKMRITFLLYFIYWDFLWEFLDICLKDSASVSSINFMRNSVRFFYTIFPWKIHLFYLSLQKARKITNGSQNTSICQRISMRGRNLKVQKIFHTRNCGRNPFFVNEHVNSDWHFS